MSQYIVVRAQNALKRDTARFLCLSLMSFDDIRTQFRQMIMEPSAASKDEMSNLAEIIREELCRINSLFPKLIANQEPIDIEGIERARRNILSLLPNDFSLIHNSRRSSYEKRNETEKKLGEFLVRESYVKKDGNPGCLKIIMAIIFLCIIIAYIFSANMK